MSGICEHFYKGYCSKYEDGCFHQCESEGAKASEKYIKLSDVMNAVGLDPGIIDYQMEQLKALPTIEASEDCISRKAIMKYIADTQLGLNPYKEEDNRVKIILDWIFDEVKNAPSVIPSRPIEGVMQDLEIIRCKDCKHRNTEECINKEWNWNWGEWSYYSEDNDFCSYGERIDNE